MIILVATAVMILGFTAGVLTSRIKTRRLQNINAFLNKECRKNWNKGYAAGWNNAILDPINVSTSYGKIFENQK